MRSPNDHHSTSQRHEWDSLEVRIERLDLVMFSYSFHRGAHGMEEASDLASLDFNTDQSVIAVIDFKYNGGIFKGGYFIRREKKLSA